MADRNAFYIKQNDLLPTLAGTVTEECTGSPVDLTTATNLLFHMRASGQPSALIATSAIVLGATVGQVEYAWASGQTATPGHYEGEFSYEIGGKSKTVPNPGYIPIRISDDIG